MCENSNHIRRGKVWNLLYIVSNMYSLLGKLPLSLYIESCMKPLTVSVLSKLCPFMHHSKKKLKKWTNHPTKRKIFQKCTCVASIWFSPILFFKTGLGYYTTKLNTLCHDKSFPLHLFFYVGLKFASPFVLFAVLPMKGCEANFFILFNKPPSALKPCLSKFDTITFTKVRWWNPKLLVWCLFSENIL